VFEVLLAAVLLILGLAALPVWPYSRAWSFVPSAAMAVVLAALLFIMLMGAL